MSLQIGNALKNGFGLLVSRAGALLTVAYVATMAVYMASYNGLMATIYAMYDVPGGEVLRPALDAPLSVLAAVLFVSLLASTYLSVVAIRTFLARERRTIPRAFATRGLLWPIINLLVGGFVLMLLYVVGLFLFVVPGLFVLVSLAFMAVYVVDEHESFVAAMRHSWGLTKGHRFRVFGLLIVVMALGGVVGFVVGFASAFLALAGGASTALGLAYVVVLAPISLFSLAVLTDAYHQLRDDAASRPPDGAASSDVPGSPA